MIQRLLPYNASLPEIALEATTGERIEAIPLPINKLWDVETCPANLLPWLAWALSVDVWKPEWSEFNKRKAIRDSAYVHQHKGTIGALKKALTLSGLNSTVIERPTDEPYTFSVIVNTTEGGLNEEAHALCLKLINETKNVRSWLINLQLSATIQATLYTNAGISSGGRTVIYSVPAP